VLTGARLAHPVTVKVFATVSTSFPGTITNTATATSDIHRPERRKRRSDPVDGRELGPRGQL